MSQPGNRWVSKARLVDLLGRQTEAFDLDYKRIYDIQSDLSHRLKFVKLTAAMTALGGDIVVGVDPHGKPTGKITDTLANVYDEASLRAILRLYLPEEISVHSQSHLVGDLLVTLVHVDPGARAR